MKTQKQQIAKKVDHIWYSRAVFYLYFNFEQQSKVKFDQRLIAWDIEFCLQKWKCRKEVTGSNKNCILSYNLVVLIQQTVERTKLVWNEINFIFGEVTIELSQLNHFVFEQVKSHNY